MARVSACVCVTVWCLYICIVDTDRDNADEDEERNFPLAKSVQFVDDVRNICVYSTYRNIHIEMAIT